MATAKMQVLDEYVVDGNELIDFRADLMLWARNWVPEIAIGIAKQADELFKSRAIRMLVSEYAHAKREDMRSFENAWERALDGEDVQPDDFRGIFYSDMSAYSQSLYMLLVK